MPGEDPAAQAADDYQRELRDFFRLEEEPGRFPSFNLVLLGLGQNTHVASLFPHHPALHEKSRLAVAVEVAATTRSRLSLTMPVINSAERVMFLVSGENKAEAVKMCFRERKTPSSIPPNS